MLVRPPLGPDELRRSIASAYAFVLPSLSDVSPNVILECIAAGTPFLLTRETGFYEALKDTGLFIDPLDEVDIADALRLLTDGKAYAAYRRRLTAFRGKRSWENVVDDWLRLVASLP